MASTSLILAKKTLRVTRGYTYAYYTSPPTANKPSILLLHGWPDSSALWLSLASKHLLPAGYGVLIPDLLGYAGTDKPEHPAAYKWKPMVQDVEELLDAENIKKVIIVGHDWGAALTSSVWNLAPARCLGICQVCVAYSKPSNGPFDLEGFNTSLAQIFGYGLFEYWHLNKRPDAAQIYEQHLDSVFDAMWAADWAAMGREVWGQPDGLYNWLTGDKRTAVHASTPEDERARFVSRFRKDGFTGPLNWYKAALEGLRDGELDLENTSVTVPFHFVAYRGDTVCRMEMIEPALKEGLLPRYSTVVLEGGHWGLVQGPEEFAGAVMPWLEREFP